MEQASKNLKFMTTQFFKFYENKSLNLSNQLLDYISEDPNNPFIDLMKDLKEKREQKKMDSNEIKMFILQQYTKGRHPTDYLADILKRFGENDHVYLDLSKTMSDFNRSDKFKDYSSDSSLTVLQTKQKLGHRTMAYKMEDNPRGLCIIILNEEEFEEEALAFQRVFKQLYFEVVIWRQLSAQQITHVFSMASKNPEYNGMNALITVCIGHGGDECFLGFGHSKQNECDQVPIINLVDIFNEQNCELFSLKPKIHVFICCRDRTTSVDNNIKTLRQFELGNIFSEKWQSKNAHSYIIYSCAEGMVAEGDADTGFSDFGRAFVHTIAQFACDYHLSDLLNKVNDRLEKEGNGDLKPQVIKNFCTHNVYFEPGYYKQQ